MHVLLSGSDVEKMRLSDCQEYSQSGLKWRLVLVSFLNPDIPPYLHDLFETNLRLGCLREDSFCCHPPHDGHPLLVSSADGMEK